jgi:integrase
MINRLKSVISSMLAYAQRRRLMPKGWQNPCKEIPCERVSNARTRFLSADERERLLRVARLSTWNKLYLLVLMALTSGARRGELLGLQYQDLDLDAGTAHLRQTKNGYERVLPLVPGVVAEIKRFGKGKPDKLLFASVRRPDQPMEGCSARGSRTTATSSHAATLPERDLLSARTASWTPRAPTSRRWHRRASAQQTSTASSTATT